MQRALRAARRRYTSMRSATRARRRSRRHAGAASVRELWHLSLSKNQIADAGLAATLPRARALGERHSQARAAPRSRRPPPRAPSCRGLASLVRACAPEGATARARAFAELQLPHRRGKDVLGGTRHAASGAASAHTASAQAAPRELRATRHASTVAAGSSAPTATDRARVQLKGWRFGSTGEKLRALLVGSPGASASSGLGSAVEDYAVSTGPLRRRSVQHAGGTPEAPQRCGARRRSEAASKATARRTTTKTAAITAATVLVKPGRIRLR